MITSKVTATTTATDLKTLLETAGYTFPTSGNDKCSGVVLQLDPDETDNSVMILSVGATEGPSLINDVTFAQPSTIALPTDKVSRIYLKASAGTPAVYVVVEHD